jgi:PAS domain S-box-containing protein
MEKKSRQDIRRRQAEEEELARRERDPAAPAAAESHMTGEEVRKLQHELRVRQIELEMQEKELLETRGRLEEVGVKYDELFDSAPVGYLTLDPDGLVLEANATLRADLGFEREATFSGEPFRNQVLFEDAGVFDQFLDELGHGGKRRSCELRLRRQDGSSFWALLQGIGSRAVDDHFACLISVMDITSWKSAEEAVREQRNLLKTIFREMPGLHSLKDSNFAYQYVNSAFQQFLGKGENEILGQTDFDLLPQQKARKYRKEDLEVMESGKALVLHEDVSTPLFGEKWLQISKIPVKDNKGRVAGIISSISDITQRKKMESELLKMQKLESVGVLAGGIAHDFNNLLTSILGNIELSKMYVGTESKAYNRLVQAENASLAAQSLTRQLLTFSRGGAPVTRMASVKELVRDSTEFTLRGSNVAIVFDLPEDLWLAEIDEGQIGQVIQNLVKNADQAMPEGGVLEIGVHNVRVTKKNRLPIKSGSYLEITVQDTGRGIPEKYQARIFDPYFTTKSQGSGLGLAVCYSIIKQHHGHIEVESRPDKGTLFRFYLPASPGKAPGKKKKDEEPYAGQGRILVMDDDETVQEIASEMLRHLGYEVDVTADGSEAIKSYVEARRLGKPYSAVLMDLTVRGGMGGREAARELLELDPETIVIAASGYATDPIMSDFRQYGFSGAVHKPFKLQALSSAFRTALEEHGR